MPSMPSHERLEAASRQFYVGVLTKLRSKSTAPTYVLIDLDIWRYVVCGKGTESNHKGFWLYSVDDMRHMQLLEHWLYTLDSHGEEKAIVQLKVKPILRWTGNQQIIKDSISTLAPCPLKKYASILFFVLVIFITCSAK